MNADRHRVFIGVDQRLSAAIRFSLAFWRCIAKTIAWARPRAAPALPAGPR